MSSVYGVLGKQASITRPLRIHLWWKLSSLHDLDPSVKSAFIIVRAYNYSPACTTPITGPYVVRSLTAEIDVPRGRLSLAWCELARREQPC